MRGLSAVVGLSTLTPREVVVGSVLSVLYVGAFQLVYSASNLTSNAPWGFVLVVGESVTNPHQLADARQWSSLLVTLVMSCGFVGAGVVFSVSLLTNQYLVTVGFVVLLLGLVVSDLIVGAELAFLYLYLTPLVVLVSVVYLFLV